MIKLLRLRNILLLFWLVQSLGAFADKGSKHPTEDKPDKPRKTFGHSARSFAPRLKIRKRHPQQHRQQSDVGSERPIVQCLRQSRSPNGRCHVVDGLFGYASPTCRGIRRCQHQRR
ncbi:MAG: hypothetical protein HC773_29065 [Scytonema sp. CRU_2_7]|nr:hypothetical protein [Scytonema sp. CRU_2_7]